MKKTGWIAAAIALLLPAIAIAGSDAPDDSQNHDHEIPLGTRTREYLDRQRSGAESSEAHGLTPPAERRARKRYLKSFEHPIPELFDTKENKEK
jgi:hypothetical protein